MSSTIRNPTTIHITHLEIIQGKNTSWVGYEVKKIQPRENVEMGQPRQMIETSRRTKWADLSQRSRWLGLG